MKNVGVPVAPSDRAIATDPHCVPGGRNEPAALQQGMPAGHDWGAAWQASVAPVATQISFAPQLLMGSHWPDEACAGSTFRAGRHAGALSLQYSGP